MKEKLFVVFRNSVTHMSWVVLRERQLSPTPDKELRSDAPARQADLAHKESGRRTVIRRFNGAASCTPSVLQWGRVIDDAEIGHLRNWWQYNRLATCFRAVTTIGYIRYVTGFSFLAITGYLSKSSSGARQF